MANKQRDRRVTNYGTKPLMDQVPMTFGQWADYKLQLTPQYAPAGESVQADEYIIQGVPAVLYQPYAPGPDRLATGVTVLENGTLEFSWAPYDVSGYAVISFPALDPQIRTKSGAYLGPIILVVNNV